MKTVYTANKGSYGTEFMEVYDTLDELKRAIVNSALQFEEEPYEYSEELYKKCATMNQYTPYKIELHDEEQVSFGEYDGTSWFFIEKKVANILSTSEKIKD